MCLTVPSKDHREVMSSGDSSKTLPSSSTSNSDTKKLAPSNQIELNEQKNSPDSHLHLDATDKIDLAGSISELDAQEQSMAPSHSNVSLENAAIDHREMTSMEGDAISLDEETGEMIQRGDARSGYFAITSVRPMDADDLDKSRHAVVSTDSVHITMEKGESGGSEDSATTISNEKQLTNNQEPSSLVKGKFIVEDIPESDYLTMMNKENEGGGISLSPKTVLIGDEAPKLDSSGGGGAMVAVATNGSSIQPNIFRRVNQYERGRWTVRDSLVTEEQADSHPPSSRLREGSWTPAATSAGGGEALPPNKTTRSDSGPAPVVDPSYSSHLPLSDLPGMLTGGGVDSISDKDSSSIPMDRSSTAAETLSRNTSMSSIIAPEKSVDGDEILHGDTDSESVAGGTITSTTATSGSASVTAPTNQNSGSHEPDEPPPPVVSPQPPLVPTSTSGAVPPPSSTAATRDEQQAAATPALDSDVNLSRVHHAMSFLQSELAQVLTSSNPQLMEENRILKTQKSVADRENVRLREELEAVKEDMRLTKEENSKLSKELKELRRSLTLLAQHSDGSGTPGGVAESGVTTDDQASLGQSSSNDTSSSSKSQGVIT